MYPHFVEKNFFLLSHLFIAYNWKLKLNNAWWTPALAVLAYRFKCKETGLASFHVNGRPRSLLSGKIQRIYLFFFWRIVSSFHFLFLICGFGLRRLHHLLFRVQEGLVAEPAFPRTILAGYRQTPDRHTVTWWERLTQFLPVVSQICLLATCAACWLVILAIDIGKLRLLILGNRTRC